MFFVLVMFYFFVGKSVDIVYYVIEVNGVLVFLG